MAAAEGHEDSGSYVLHHLTNLKLDLRTLSIDPAAKGFWVLNLDSVIFSLLLGSLVLFVFLKAARAATSGKPGGLLNFIEMTLEFWERQVREVFPQANPLVVPLAITIFVWVLFMNFMDIVPVDLLPFVAGKAGVEHLRIVPSTDVNITFGLSLSVFILIIGYNVVFKGPVGFLKEVLTHPFGPWLFPVNFALRIVEEIARPVSLALRLFGNLFAGELIFVLIALLLAQLRTGIGGAVLSLVVGFLSQLAWTFFHVLVIPLQAFVFAVLTVVYLSTAATSHSEEH
ncbi:MAG: F0F1 ATP synthase subunit A [Nevskia sp.]|nr:F0F1 ATP synthase subunit A [Nevskia sp.]